MSIASQIKQMAAEVARKVQSHTSHLQSELAEIETRKSAIQARLKVARLSAERALNFQPQIGPYFQCPRCWVEDEKRSGLAPISGGERNEDFFRCRACGYELTISA